MSEKFEEHLETVDEERRAVLRKLVRTSAFVVPVVASFTMKGGVSVAMADVANAS